MGAAAPNPPRLPSVLPAAPRHPRASALPAAPSLPPTASSRSQSPLVRSPALRPSPFSRSRPWPPAPLAPPIVSVPMEPSSPRRSRSLSTIPTSRWSARRPRSPGSRSRRASGAWRYVDALELDTAARTLTAQITHFSDWTHVLGLQLRPPSAEVDPRGSVNLEIKDCMTPFDGPIYAFDCVSFDFGDGDDLPSLPSRNNPQGTVDVNSWAVNGDAGGGAIYGFVEGTNVGAEFIAPAEAPEDRNPVAVSVDIRDHANRKVATLVSNILIKGGNPTIHVVGGVDTAFYGIAVLVGADVTDKVEFDMVMDPNGTLTFSDVRCSSPPAHRPGTRGRIHPLRWRATRSSADLLRHDVGAGVPPPAAVLVAGRGAACAAASRDQQRTEWPEAFDAGHDIDHGGSPELRLSTVNGAYQFADAPPIISPCLCPPAHPRLDLCIARRAGRSDPAGIDRRQHDGAASGLRRLALVEATGRSPCPRRPSVGLCSSRWWSRPASAARPRSRHRIPLARGRRGARPPLPQPASLHPSP